MAGRTLRIGDTEVPRIGLGTNRLTHTRAHVAFIADAVRAGIGMVDTAHIYAGGDSERTIGEALQDGLDGVVIATKGGYAPGHGRPEVLRAQVRESLRRLRTECIDLYYLHRVDPETPLEESLGVIRECQDAGTIRLAGLSAVTVDEIERAQRVLTVSAVQNHYNLAQRDDDDVVAYCEAQGIAFVPYYPLGERGSALAGVARRLGASEPQVALAWLLHRSPATLPIPGTLSLDHVRENVGALDIELSADDVEALRRTA